MAPAVSARPQKGGGGSEPQRGRLGASPFLFTIQRSARHDWVRREEIKKLVASDMSLATSWHERSKSIFRPALNGPSGPRRVCAVQAFWPKAKTLAQGEFISPEHWNQNGWSDQRERKKTRPWHVFFWKREVKIDISGLRKKPPAGRSQPRAQRKRVAVGSEEQQNERAMRFVMK